MFKNTPSGFLYAAGIAAMVLTPAAVYAQGSHSLLEAASKNDVAATLRYLNTGTAVNTVRDANGWTALIVAARNGATDTAKLLLERGADANAAGKTGYTPLLAAAEFGDPELIRLLLLHNADPNKATPRGLTPLMMAASNKFGPKAEAKDLECVKLLLRGGADPDKKHQSGSTALSVAEDRHATQIAAFLRHISGAGAVTASSVKDGTITGTVAYRERIALSPTAFVIVSLVETSGKKPVSVTQTIVLSQGAQVPLHFSLPYKAAELTAKPGARFALDARIVANGTILFRTTSPLPVFGPGAADKNVALLLSRAEANPTPALSAEAIAATDKALAMAGTTVSGHRVAEETDSRYTASFLGGKLVRIVATTTQGNYGNRTDRFYFGEGTNKGYPDLRAAYLSAHRLAREAAPMAGGQVAGIRFSGNYEEVHQSIILGNDGVPVFTSKTIDKQKHNVETPDITAARNFARLLVTDMYRTASKNHH